jgi:hypothetical protein
VPSSQKLASSPNITTPRQAAAFFDRRKPHAQPVFLGHGIRAGQALAWTLHGEPELV